MALDCGITGILLGHDTEGTLMMTVKTSGATWTLPAADLTRQSKPDDRLVRKATLRDQATTASTTDHHLTNTLLFRDPRRNRTKARLVKHTTPDLFIPLHDRRRNHYINPSIAQNQHLHDQVRSPSTQTTTRRHRQYCHKLQTFHRSQQWIGKNASPSAQPPTSRMTRRSGQSSCLLCCARSSSVLQHQTHERASKCAEFCAGHPLTTRCSSAVSSFLNRPARVIPARQITKSPS